MDKESLIIVFLLLMCFQKKKMVGNLDWKKVKETLVVYSSNFFVGVTFNDVGVKVFPQTKLKLKHMACMCLLLCP